MDIIYKILNINRFFPLISSLNMVWMLLFSDGKNNLYATNDMQNRCIIDKIKVAIENNFSKSI